MTYFDASTNTTNSKAIGSLLLGILSIMIPFIGLVLGIIGIIFARIAKKQLTKTNENGRGLAISGFICSVIGIIIQLFIILSLITYYSITTVGIS
ncbi:DUF4190 domain-containing protein [Virgibacillus halodenitrificans]|uniref:DUF4190 domain-containing protein n=1 Tax=Virgibacillus halodenitrificans TaxID=1482 RepID=UPI00045CAD53|nr:DUF4190 domain-containing protein [Virgibacillus halodenitrificans]CDQ32610.1 hypothetical protein BN993_02028 [Virgibacillus halodenitrificans]